ncbi:MAG: GNAT family N-acetyltransferase [Deltaproteobacteria bacterium]|nr:GNAT family N-acetyltransferase [Deltaproteobacteria bacterium]
MIKTKAFHVKHYLDLEVEKFMFGDIGRIPESALYRLADSPYMKTICNPDGFPIMIIGVVPVGIGIGEVFILPGKGWVYYTIEVCRAIKTDLNRILMFHHRIQATCNANDEKYSRFLELFGFKREGTLRHYNTKGEDFYMYSIISGDEK